MTREEAKALIEKYNQGLTTPEERVRLERWYHSEQAAQRLSDDEADFLHLKDAIWQGTLVRAGLKGTPRKITSWLPYAAAILLATTAVAWLFLGDRNDPGSQRIADRKTEDVAPGGNRAVLTLADGRTIDLSTEQSGITVSDEDITYDDGVSAVVTLGANQPALTMLSLSTPKGGTYQVTLPDGSKVWLNANSTLKYPNRFAGDERAVEIEGEGYFEIGKDPKRPFRVRSGDQTVEVLGTQFNISAYADNAETKTTLVEGKVRVATDASGSAVTLSPGELATLSRAGEMAVAKANVKKETAWKSGWFHFERTAFADMMQQIGRWYDVDIRYEADVPNGVFGGVMDRNVSLKTLLEYLGESGLAFDLDGRTLTVRAKDKP